MRGVVSCTWTPGKAYIFYVSFYLILIHNAYAYIYSVLRRTDDAEPIDAKLDIVNYVIKVTWFAKLSGVLMRVASWHSVILPQLRCLSCSQTALHTAPSVPILSASRWGSGKKWAWRVSSICRSSWESNPQNSSTFGAKVVNSCLRIRSFISALNQQIATPWNSNGLSRPLYLQSEIQAHGTVPVFKRAKICFAWQNSANWTDLCKSYVTVDKSVFILLCVQTIVLNWSLVVGELMRENGFLSHRISYVCNSLLASVAFQFWISFKFFSALGVFAMYMFYHSEFTECNCMAPLSTCVCLDAAFRMTSIERFCFIHSGSLLQAENSLSQ